MRYLERQSNTTQQKDKATQHNSQEKKLPLVGFTCSRKRLFNPPPQFIQGPAPTLCYMVYVLCLYMAFWCVMGGGEILSKCTVHDHVFLMISVYCDCKYVHMYAIITIVT